MSAEPLSGAEIVIQALVDQGVEVVFGYPGGAVLPIYDALFKQNALRHILVRHEQGAVHAAEGYARSTGRVGVVLVTSGPGATNAVTGLTDALMDSVPIVCLTGQVPTHLIGNDAFQEADTTGITRPCTKHNYLVKDVGELARMLHEAFYVAKSGRPGPVVVDLPKDILFAPGPYSEPEQGQHKSYRPQLRPDPDADRRGGRDDRRGKAAAVLWRRRADQFRARGLRPLYRAGAADRCAVHPDPDGARRLSRGRPAFPRHGRHARHLRGEFGDARLRPDDRRRLALRRSGDRPAQRLLARLEEDPHRHRSVLDQQECARRCADHRRCRRGVVGDARRLAERRRAAAGDAARAKWWRTIDGWRARDCLRYDRSRRDLIKPQYAIERLYALTRERDVYITTEVGQHQMWAAQFFKFEEPYHWMTSGGLGTMGYGLPAAIGVQIAHPEALVIDIAGEASILMNIQEMSTAAQYRLPVKVFILNNQYMGMVRQWQELLHGGRYSESYTAALPDFVKLAEAFGAVGLRVEHPAEVDAAIGEMLAADRAVILDVAVDPAENCFPMIPSGAAHNEMLLGPEDKAEKPVSEEGMVLV